MTTVHVLLIAHALLALTLSVLGGIALRQRDRWKARAQTALEVAFSRDRAAGQKAPVH